MPQERLVERGDLRPIRRGFGVQSGDRRLQLIRARTSQSQGALERSLPCRDLLGVPEVSVLVLQEHERSVRSNARVASRILQLHECVESVHLGFIGHQHCEHTTEANRLAAELGGVCAGLRVNCLHRVAALQRVDHEVLQPVGDRRRVGVDDDQDPPRGRAPARDEHRLEAFERIAGSGSHGGGNLTPVPDPCY